MSFSMRTILLVALLATPVSAIAAQDYRCTIKHVVSASSAPNQEAQSSAYVGKEFTVERRSGLMAGVLKNSFSTKPVVIDLGSTENSYKVVTTMRREQGVGAGSNIYALTIQEYEAGPAKPFVFLQNDMAFFGQCAHF
jgi:hypothetical protein